MAMYLARSRLAKVAADLQQIFERLRSALAEHSPPFVARTVGVKDKLDYQLWSDKDVVIDGRPRKEVYFAGLTAQKGYVGFYYMPVYAQLEIGQLFAPELLELLKGKSYFHINRLDDELLGQIRDALDAGTACTESEVGSRRLRPRRRAGRGTARPQPCGC
jgi:hypothetical protein